MADRLWTIITIDSVPIILLMMGRLLHYKRDCSSHNTILGMPQKMDNKDPELSIIGDLFIIATMTKQRPNI